MSYIGFWNVFQPNSLPYTGNGRIPNTFRIFHLLTTWLRPFIRWIPHSDRYLLCLSFFKVFADIKIKWIETTLMTTHLLAIYVYVTLPIYCSEMQQYIFLAIYGF